MDRVFGPWRVRPTTKQLGLWRRFWGSQVLLHLPSSGFSPYGAPSFCEAPGQAQADSCLPRNVLSERERRKRISLSCDRLRVLLPRFEGRREDMASVLEMAVQFLRLAGSLAPGREQHTVLGPSKETWHRWQKDILQLVLASQTAAGASDPDMGASGISMQQASLSCAPVSMDQSVAPLGVAEVLDRPLPHREPSCLLPLSPSKAPRPAPTWGPLVSEEMHSCPGQAGHGADLALSMPDSRSLSACDMEDGASFLLTASPDWWLGSLEPRASGVSSWAPARSSPLDKAESSFLGDPEPGPQDSPLEPWGVDVGYPGLTLKDEADSIFPDFLAY
ncbi:spermatogenesis- and oogenesis-specific basic helix-loop-helix-containing protein 1 [Erinaceus europaeus]|uniref:Spermatogenesis- and oogenesis-specific basic helix-loop-helix-containing protein 1 n=1 Tax=Erinaceus europaeus TaxID=9365 RepID=A0A1S2ZMD0_ERIEU|nr:spermatogenesis- and oogenesis-specific basic helix-loop-helix-containing protein 1 [Erinaceus europaeus]